jgi:hypothetical protein
MSNIPDQKLANSPQPRATLVVPAARVASNREEVIQIIPHPTTNRYPWTPVQNPRVVLQQPTVSPIIRTTVKLMRASPQPTVAKPVPVAVKPSAPTPVLPAVAVMQPPIATPTPPLVQRPLPPIVLPPQPAAQARPFVAQPVPPVVQEPQPKPAQLMPAVQVVAQPLPHVYSDYTREVWRVFRPNRIIKLMVLGFIALIIIGAVALWVSSGKPSIFELPFLRSQ